MTKFIALFFLAQTSLAFSQTVLTSYPLELKKSKEFQQIINAQNTITQDVFVFASDKENVTILKYNSALFLSDNFTIERPNLDYKLLIGYSFNEKGVPTLYWSSTDSKNVIAVEYNLNTKITTSFIYELPFYNEKIVNQFQNNNCFYILSKKKGQQKLVLYVFKNGRKEEKILDFSSFKFQNKKTEQLTLDEILDVYPIEEIITNEFTPLFKCTQKTKMYLSKNRLLLTLDHNFKETQTLDIDLNSFTIQEKKFPQPVIKTQISSGNSFFYENKLYQLTANEDELIFEIKDYNTGSALNNFHTKKTDTIGYKNTPLFLQIDGQKPTELKSTSRFLQRLLFLNTGLTVYKTQKEILVTIGGTKERESNPIDYFTGINAAMSGALSYSGEVLINSQSINLYFESALDKNLNHSTKKQEPLAIDFISRFVYEHKEVTLQNTFRFKNYYIFGYYDSKAKHYMMRKFIDGFMHSFP